MSNIFKGMNRKQKREYNKLGPDKKAQILQAAVMDKISGPMAQEIAKAMIAGMEFEREQLYQKYVKIIDDTEKVISEENLDYDIDDWGNEVDKLLSFLRIEHLKYQQKQMKNMKDGEKNEV